MKKLLGYLLLIIAVCQLMSCSAIVVGGGAAVAMAKDHRTAGDMIEDENIELKFSYQLMQEKSLNEQSHVNATSYDGWLLLTGETITAENRQAIYNIGSSIKNVSRIFNEVTVGPLSDLSSRAEDTYITTKIKSRLLASKEAQGFHIKVVTENKVVYLMGLIDEQQAAIAINEIKTVSGIERIVKLFNYQ